MYRNILNLARLFVNHTIYLPCFYDFRGSIYPLVNDLSYQGGDIARSLFLFKENKDNKFNIEYLYIYMGNVYGLNKMQRDERVKWVKDNLNFMISLYKDDRNKFNIDFLSKAKEKAQFMA